MDRQFLILVLHFIQPVSVWSSTTPPGSMDPSFYMIHMTNLELALANVQGQLRETQEKQRTTAEELVSIKAELRFAENKVFKMEIQLNQVVAEHNTTLKDQGSTLEELASVKAELRLSENSLSAVRTQMRDLLMDHNKTVSELRSVKDELGTTHDNNIRLQTEFDMLRSDARAAEGDLAVVKYQTQQHETEIGNINKDIDNIKSEVEHKDSNMGLNQPHIDKTVLDLLHADVQSNVVEMTLLRSKLDSATHEINKTSLKMESLQTQMYSYEKNVSKELKNMEKQVLLHSQANPDLKNQIGSESTEVQDLIARLGSVEMRLENTTNNLNIMGSEFHSFRYYESACKGNQSTNVGFEMRLQMEQMDVHMGEKLMFDKTLYNHGGGYDGSTGIFTTPVTGSYLFWAQIMMAQANSMFELFLERNGMVIGKSFTETSEEQVYGVLSFTGVTHLNKGDLVWFQKAKGTEKMYGKLYSGYGAVLVSTG